MGIAELIFVGIVLSMIFWSFMSMLLMVGSIYWSFRALYDLLTPDSDKDEEIEIQLHHDKIVSIDGNTITVEYKEINDEKIY